MRIAFLLLVGCFDVERSRWGCSRFVKRIEESVLERKTGDDGEKCATLEGYRLIFILQFLTFHQIFLFELPASNNTTASIRYYEIPRIGKEYTMRLLPRRNFYIVRFTRRLHNFSEQNPPAWVMST